MRLIDADALFEVIKKSMAENPHKEKTQRAMHIHEHKYFLTLLTTFPTIQPEERTEERTETHACVLIRQQDAVELAMKYCPDDDGTVQCGGDIRELLDELENLPPVQPEITQDQLKEYCKKRCLTAITDDLYYKLTSDSENTATWLIHKWGDDAKCSNCGHTFKDVYDMDNHDRFCRFCGSKMEGIETIK